MKKLQEKTIDFKQLYKKTFGLNREVLSFGNVAFTDIDTAKELFYAAKDNVERGDSSKEAKNSFLYLYKIVFQMAAKYFWTFLGPNPHSQQIRIENDGFYDYATLCTEAMYKAIQKYDPEKADTIEELKHGIQYYFRGYIKAGTLKYNAEYNLHGLTGQGLLSGTDENGEKVHVNDEINVIRPDSYDMDGNKSAWDSVMTGPNAYDDVSGGADDYDFKETWKRLCQDPSLHGKKPYNKMMASILSGNSVEDVAEEFGVSKNTVREKFFSTKHNRENGSNGLLADLCKKYDISQEDLAAALQDYPEFIINSLRK